MKKIIALIAVLLGVTLLASCGHKKMNDEYRDKDDSQMEQEIDNELVNDVPDVVVPEDAPNVGEGGVLSVEGEENRGGAKDENAEEDAANEDSSDENDEVAKEPSSESINDGQLTADSSDAEYDGDYTLDTENSSLAWSGAKVVGGGHDGLVSLSSGSLSVEDGSFAAGKAIIDMNTIVATDISGGAADSLATHLKADDFFGVETYPEAMIIITSVEESDEGYSVTGDLTIRDVTESLTFPATIVGEDGMIKLNTSFSINRATWKIASGFKGAVLKDELDFTLDLAFTK